MGRFAMLRPGDRVAVGRVGRAKDSLCLLDALVAYRTRAPPSPTTSSRVTIEQGKFKSDIRALGARPSATSVCAGS